MKPLYWTVVVWALAVLGFMKLAHGEGPWSIEISTGPMKYEWHRYILYKGEISEGCWTDEEGCKDRVEALNEAHAHRQGMSLKTGVYNDIILTPQQTDELNQLLKEAHERKKK